MPMSDIEHVLNTFESSGPGMAAALAGAYVAKRVFGPSLDSVGARLKEISDARLANFSRITAKADALRPDVDIYPHVRVTKRVLNDATFYDDNVQQTYVAGMLAGSRNDDGSDDRPVFYLSLIDGLTAAHLTIFHGLYCAAEEALQEHGMDGGMNFSLVAVDADDLNEQLAVLNPEDRNDAPSALFALAHVGLIDQVQTWVEPPAGLAFRPTRIGAILFDWAYGFDDEDFVKFLDRGQRPDIGLPTLHFRSLRFAPGTNPEPQRPEMQA